MQTNMILGSSVAQDFHVFETEMQTFILIWYKFCMINIK